VGSDAHGIRRRPVHGALARDPPQPTPANYRSHYSRVGQVLPLDGPDGPRPLGGAGVQPMAAIACPAPLRPTDVRILNTPQAAQPYREMPCAYGGSCWKRPSIADLPLRLSHCSRWEKKGSIINSQ